MSIPAITLWQPYASLIAVGLKMIETRSWAAPKALIGQRIAIHAAKRYPVPFQDDVIGDFKITEDIPLGAVVCFAVLADCVPIDRWTSAASHKIGDFPHDGPRPHQLGGLWLIGPGEPNHGHPTRVEDQRPYGDFTPGRWAWLLTDIEALAEPAPATGRQGIWTWTP